MLRGKTLLGVCLASLSLATAAIASEAKAFRTLKIGVTDPICKKSACSCVDGTATREYDSMIECVVKKTGIKLEMVYFEDELLLRQEILDGNLDGMLGKMSPCASYAKEAGRKFERVADITKPDGKASLSGLFIVHKECPVKELPSAKGLVFAFGQECAPEKHELAFKTLDRLGIPVPSKEERQEYFTCKEAALALIEKRADVAVISDYALEFGCIVVVGDPADFRVIGKTDKAIPFTTLMLDSTVPEDIRGKLAKSLLSMKGGDVPKELLSKGWVAPVPWPEGIANP